MYRQKYHKMRRQFWGQRAQAKVRGIEWNLTEQEWIDWWLSTGKWEKRGTKKGQYVMARHGDTGPYSLDNIKCITNTENHREGRLDRPGKKNRQKGVGGYGRNYSKILGERDVAEILKLEGKGISVKSIAEKYGIHRSRIYVLWKEKQHFDQEKQ